VEYGKICQSFAMLRKVNKKLSAMTYPKYVWQNPTSKHLGSFPEDSPFDPIIPFHL
jgi:hypothetical protein